MPTFSVANRKEVGNFLGFRHIGGLRPWSPEAKARYLAKEVDEAHQADIGNPFHHVGSRVGSNTQGVRNFYIALRTLLHARDEGGIDIGYVLRERFTVWLRCMNSTDIRIYIGLRSTKTYEEIQNSLTGLDVKRLEEVIKDLTPQKDREKALFTDSRDITQYGLILQNTDARDMLREYGDLELAKHVILHETLTKRVEDISRRVSAIEGEIRRSSPNINEELLNAIDNLAYGVKFLQSIVDALAK